ncbi:MAG TPA: SGNH/GDSL hydrolase family protein [Chryseolinea sp.]
MKKLLCILLLVSIHGMAQKLIVREEVKLLALGDSYTIGESVALSSRWPMQLVDSLQKRGVDCLQPKIIATTGWRTDNLNHAISKTKFKEEYNLVSLLIGVNNYYQGRSVESYAPEFEELLNTAIQLAGGDKSSVFVLSIPDYGYTPFGKENQAKITEGIDAYNAVNKSISEKYGVKYYNITDISRRGLDEVDLVASDGLHPSEKMYSEWVEVILSDINVVPQKDER